MKPKKQRRNLEARQRAWDEMRSEGGNTEGKWVKTGGGKNQFFHRPGSQKGK